jgi:hypothetical protein
MAVGLVRGFFHFGLYFWHRELEMLSVSPDSLFSLSIHEAKHTNSRFYIHPPNLLGRKAVILIPSWQFQHFLDAISERLEIEVKMPENATEMGLIVEFPKDGTPRPRYLGHTTDREMADGLKQAIPSLKWRPKGESNTSCEPTEQSLVAFNKKMELLLESEKTKKRAATKEKRMHKRIAKQQDWNHSIKRVQRYLGIRERLHGQHTDSQALGNSSVSYGLGEPSVSTNFFL